ETSRGSPARLLRPYVPCTRPRAAPVSATTQLLRRNAAWRSVSRQTGRRRSMMHGRGGCMTTIRQARLQDARAIGRIEVETWRASYAGMLPDRVLLGMSEQRQ